MSSGWRKPRRPAIAKRGASTSPTRAFQAGRIRSSRMAGCTCVTRTRSSCTTSNGRRRPDRPGLVHGGGSPEIRKPLVLDPPRLRTVRTALGLVGLEVVADTLDARGCRASYDERRGVIVHPAL